MAAAEADRVAQAEMEAAMGSRKLSLAEQARVAVRVSALGFGSGLVVFGFGFEFELDLGLGSAVGGWRFGVWLGLANPCFKTLTR